MPVYAGRIVGALIAISAIRGGVLTHAQTLVEQPAPVTFSEHVAPIIFKHCSGCHRPGGGAPFDLLTYGDARPWATQIAMVTKSRRMPPWKPEPGFGDFEGVRRLSDGEVAVIQRWVAQGAAAGNAVITPQAPQWATDWQLGPPDLVLAMPEPYVLTSDGPDVFRSFVLSIPVTVSRYVNGVEFRPGNSGAVHHANLKIDRTGSSKRLDQSDSGSGFDGGGGRDAAFPDGHFLGWTPGQSPRLLKDSAWRLEPDSDLVVELHMMPIGKPQPIQVAIGLYFTDQPPARVPYMLRLGSQSLDIPAGVSSFVSEDRYVLPVDVEVLAVQPHAHNLARQIEGFVELPDGQTRWLIRITDWDFHWQDVYRYVEPVRVPRGATVIMRYVYDNSGANIRNPNRPPKRVTFGQTTSSEMGDLWLQVVTRTAADRAALDADYAPKMLQEDIAGDEKILELNPNDARVHADLAQCYLQQGRASDAIAHLQRAVELEPDLAAGHYELGTVLLREKRLDEAEAQFTRAVGLKPDFSEAMNNLGAVSLLRGALDAATDWFGRALSADSHNGEAHYNLARVLVIQRKPETALGHYLHALRIRRSDPDVHSGMASLLSTLQRPDEAIAHYREAIRLNPDLVAALTDLAWMLASSDRVDLRAPAEAVRLAERAAYLTGDRNAVVLDTLALAYFSAGQVQRAANVARAALDLASHDSSIDLADRIRERLRFYEEHQPQVDRIGGF